MKLIVLFVSSGVHFGEESMAVTEMANQEEALDSSESTEKCTEGTVQSFFPFCVFFSFLRFLFLFFIVKLCGFSPACFYI